MSDRRFEYRLGPTRRAASLFLTMFVRYPCLIAKLLLLRRPSIETLMYLVISPLWVLRNGVATFFSAIPLPLSVDYRLTLHPNHLSFGPTGDEGLANSYFAIVDYFRLCGKWTILLRDGYLVFLPPGSEGDEAIQTIRERQNRRPEPSETLIPFVSSSAECATESSAAKDEKQIV